MKKNYSPKISSISCRMCSSNPTMLAKWGKVASKGKSKGGKLKKIKK